MDRFFPFGFPGPTAFYLTLYVATLVIHVVFMNYVLAGSAYLAAITVLRRDDRDAESADPIAAPLRDWLPFMLSAAITAGIAPLLFLQILYRRQFYSANLLLLHRWMAILPALIVGFYLLYLLKSRFLSERSLTWRIAVGCGAFLCFAFTAWSWTENHLLSLNEAVWPEQFASGRLFYRRFEVVPRLAMWFAGAFPTMATIVAWQWLYLGPGDYMEAGRKNDRCAILAMGGLAAAGLFAGISLFFAGPEFRGALAGPAARWYLAAAGVGWVVQLIGWYSGWRRDVLSARTLLIATAGLLLTIGGTAVVREMRRIVAVDITRLETLHADAAKVGGFGVFLFFAVVNAGLIAGCLWGVSRGLALGAAGKSGDVESVEGR